MQPVVRQARRDGGVAEHGARKDRHRPRHRHHPPGFLSVADLADRGPLSLSGFYAEIQRRRLKAFQWRGILMVAEQDYRDWCETVVPHQPSQAAVAAALVEEPKHA